VSKVDQDSALVTADPDETLDDNEQVVIFRMDKEEFGVPIARGRRLCARQRH
jgi:chemotaxis signal transduction protein